MGFLSKLFSRKQGARGVREMQFVIADGETISLPVTDRGFPPAENNNFKIEMAGFSVGPHPVNAAQMALSWGFAFTSKQNAPLESVLVEEVASSGKAIPMVSEGSPSLDKGTWLGSVTPVVMSKENMPWLYTSESSIFVFRFTIKVRNAAPVVLYQPSAFSDQTKASFRNMAVKGSA